MTKSDQDTLSPAECASRTGLTIRALRVYERYGLLKPQRTANGWRRYGPEELTRLNTITVLKTAGLSLKQIRDVIHQRRPSLPDILRAQIETWKTRRVEADRGQAIAEAALMRLQAHDALSIDEMCQLIRGLEMSDVWTNMQHVLDEHMSREEKQVWIQRVVAHPESVQRFAVFSEAMRDQVYGPLKALIAGGARPGSKPVQQLVIRQCRLMTEYGIREMGARVHAWNSPLVKKFMRAGVTLYERLKQRPDEMPLPRDLPEPELVDYMAEAFRQSTLRRDLDDLLQRAAVLLHRDTAINSQVVDELADQFRAACATHHLGEPLTFARWAPYYHLDPPVDRIPVDQPLWDFLASAVEFGGVASDAATG